MATRTPERLHSGHTTRMEDRCLADPLWPLQSWGVLGFDHGAWDASQSPSRVGAESMHPPTCMRGSGCHLTGTGPDQSELIIAGSSLGTTIRHPTEHPLHGTYPKVAKLLLHSAQFYGPTGAEADRGGAGHFKSWIAGDPAVRAYGEVAFGSEQVSKWFTNVYRPLTPLRGDPAGLPAHWHQPSHDTVIALQIMLAAVQAAHAVPVQVSCCGFSAGNLHVWSVCKAILHWPRKLFGLDPPRVRQLLLGAPGLPPSSLEPMAALAEQHHARILFLVHPNDTLCPTDSVGLVAAKEWNLVSTIKAPGSLDTYLFGYRCHALELLGPALLTLSPPKDWRIGLHSHWNEFALLQNASMSMLAVLAFPLHLLAPVMPSSTRTPRHLGPWWQPWPNGKRTGLIGPNQCCSQGAPEPPYLWQGRRGIPPHGQHLPPSWASRESRPLRPRGALLGGETTRSKC